MRADAQGLPDSLVCRHCKASKFPTRGGAKVILSAGAVLLCPTCDTASVGAK